MGQLRWTGFIREGEAYLTKKLDAAPALDSMDDVTPKN